MAARRPPQLVQLVYASTAAHDLSEADLESLADESRRRHEAAELTGLLLHQGDDFFGVIEGPERSLMARMEQLITDPRHARLRVLREEPIARRRFENWSYGTLPRKVPGATSAEAFILSLARRLK